jgi:hypothetical protein
MLDIYTMARRRRCIKSLQIAVKGEEREASKLVGRTWTALDVCPDFVA